MQICPRTRHLVEHIAIDMNQVASDIERGCVSIHTETTVERVSTAVKSLPREVLVRLFIGVTEKTNQVLYARQIAANVLTICPPAGSRIVGTHLDLLT